MSKFANAPDGTAIAYDAEGPQGAAAPPILLIHGFAASRVITWHNTGWTAGLMKDRRVLTMDCRGHGESGKPHDPQAYDEARMVGDALAVLDAEGILRADVMGYSMGGYLAIRLAHDFPGRLRRVVLGGVGGHYFDYWQDRSERVAEALEVPHMADVTDDLGREFRRFAEAAKGDLAALAACMRRPRKIYSRDELHGISLPVLIVCGENDDVSGPAEALAPFFADARAVVIAGRDHHRTVGDHRYKEAVRGFLSDERG